jgi:uncharacterized protein
MSRPGNPEPVMPRVIRRADCPVMAWKNGGGSTTEILVSPPDAGLDDFDWRVSMAEVATDGPFSAFPGIDRTLAILSGEGLRLEIGGATPVELTGSTAPLAFPADQPTRARLLGGPVVDLNVMTRRGRFRHTLRWLSQAAGASLPVTAHLLMVLAAGGPADLSIGGSTFHLGERDVLLAGSGQTREIVSLSPCRLCLGEIGPA